MTGRAPRADEPFTLVAPQDISISRTEALVIGAIETLIIVVAVAVALIVPGRRG